MQVGTTASPPNPGEAEGEVKVEGDDKAQFSFTEDFICISEFSEIVGPVPLFCIPENATGNFNLEKFVIRIMAVDYQNKAQDAGTFMEDTQVVISEASEDAHAYVHHFTLLDVYARGYVRPICMSYITRHPTKIMDNFADILDRFLKISHIFKTGNQQVFLKDVEQRIADLYHTKAVLERQELEKEKLDAQENGESKGEGDCATFDPSSADAFFGGQNAMFAPTPSVVNDTIKEMKQIRDRLKETMLQKHHYGLRPPSARKGSAPNLHDNPEEKKKREEQTKKEEEEEEEEEDYDDEDYDGDDDKDKDIFVSEGEGDGEAELLVLVQRESTESNVKGDENELPEENKVVEVKPEENTENQTVEKTETKEAESNETTNKEATQATAPLTETDVAEICKGMGLNLEGYEPKLVMSLYKGRKYETKLRELDELCGENFNSAMRKVSQLREHYARPSLILTLENEELGLLEPVSTLLTAGSSVLCNFNLNTYTHPAAYKSPHGSYRRKRSISASTHPPEWAESSATTSGATSPGSSSYDSVEEGSPAADFGQRIWLSGDFSEELSDRLQGLGLESETTPHVMICPPATLEPEKTNNNDAYDLSPRKRPTHQKLDVECWAASLWDYSNADAGKGIKDVLKYSFSKHLIYSLLKGRPVIIYAQSANEESVKKLVTACSLFVLTRQPGAITPWRTTQLKMSDLAHIKLAGMAKTASIPRSVERYISVFDYEAGTLLCPPYEHGTFIDKILGLKHRWPDESTHLAYIHCKLLEISIQACLYYHICCISSNNVYNQPNEVGTAGNAAPTGGPATTTSTTTPSSGFFRSLTTPWQQPQHGSVLLSPAPPPKITGGSASASSKTSRTRTFPRRRLTDAVPHYATEGGGSAVPGPLSLSMGGLPNANLSTPSTGGSAPPKQPNKRYFHSDGQLQSIMVPPGMPPSARDQAKAAFCKQMNAKLHDMAIIEHFAEVVKEQQAMELHGPGEQVVPVIKLDYTQCKLFNKNTKQTTQRGKKTSKKLLQL